MDDRETAVLDIRQPPTLTIATTLYRSRQFVETFYNEACRVAGARGVPFEVLFVNDGSPDDSLDVALALHKRDPRVKVVDLSRNFGHHSALMTAFAHASGDLVYVTDVDLEEPMDFLRSCEDRFRQGDCDVVYGYQDQRRGSGLSRKAGEWFWKLFNLLCNTKVPANIVTARLMSKRYVTSLLEHPERDPWIPGLWVSTGYNQVGLPIEKQSGTYTSYSVARRVKLAVNSIISFSSRPLLLSAGLGVFICLMASLYVVYLIGLWLVLGGNPIEGWTSLIISVWFMGGVNLFFIGLVGLYVSKIFTEVKQRPNVIVRHVYGDAQRVQPAQDAKVVHYGAHAPASNVLRRTNAV